MLFRVSLDDDVPVAAGFGVPVAAGFGLELGTAVELVALGVADTSGSCSAVSSSWSLWSSGEGGPRGAWRLDFTRSLMFACLLVCCN